MPDNIVPSLDMDITQNGYPIMTNPIIVNTAIQKAPNILDINTWV